jgi:hypothetical protein
MDGWGAGRWRGSRAACGCLGEILFMGIAFPSLVFGGSGHLAARFPSAQLPCGHSLRDALSARGGLSQPLP